MTDGSVLSFTRELLSAQADSERRGALAGNTEFGSALTSHMVSADWTAERGWHNGALLPYRPIAFDPATVGLHYGQVIFEGLKAYRTYDGKIAVFRPEAHAGRFRHSARRLIMPEMDTGTFVRAIDELIGADAGWVPFEAERSLYLRPLLYASEPRLALRPAREFRFLLMAFVTELFFGAPRAIKVWISTDYTRASQGGTGGVKYAGNYALAYAAQLSAAEQGCDQVLWLDSVERRWVEELGATNLFCVEKEGDATRLVTPPLGGTILPGVTRDTLLAIAPEVGLEVEERPIAIDELRESCAAGKTTEVFASGTAAQIAPVGTFCGPDGEWAVADGQPGPVADMLGKVLADIERGSVAGHEDWLHYV
jgi:branched-chain amino acid aminotransferase